MYEKGEGHDICNYRPICLLSVVYKLFTRVILNMISRTLNEGQPYEEAGFRRGFSTIDHIHTITKLIEVSREYKLPLCLTFIDLKKAFDSVEIEAVMEAPPLCLAFVNLKKAFESVETEAVVEALFTQGVPSQTSEIFTLAAAVTATSFITLNASIVFWRFNFHARSPVGPPNAMAVIPLRTNAAILNAIPIQSFWERRLRCWRHEQEDFNVIHSLKRVTVLLIES
ncbi:unnamed protein product [Heligmosomoides polygyrus]|uniref:Reverse transcriptase domain-containing protein n=1 Tax=Heligmosomoides polygyrus TaxID=6339 RepID=A0A3P7UBM2_HELPZ|nr:unnamed protein product [Heligmosomoides polygyrus]